MAALPQLLVMAGVMLAALLLIVLPLQWAARVMAARRTGFGWCFLALIGATILHSLGLMAPVAGTIVAFLLSALGFASLLGTDYLRGIGIALLYLIFSVGLVFVLSALFGISLAAWRFSL